MKQHVETLIKKAAEASDSQDAMRLSQAACNVANAMCALKYSEEPQINRATADTRQDV